jgi:hypothetical protein
MFSPSSCEKLAAYYVARSPNQKLSPVSVVKDPDSKRLVIRLRPPFVAATAVSTAATCPDTCPFKDSCYYKYGLTMMQSRRLNRAATGLTSSQVMAQEVLQIDRSFRGRGIPQDGARGGRDLRLHVGGDVGSTRDAKMLASAADRWAERGGGKVWTYTHRAKEIPREAWGCGISVLGSVEIPADIEVLRKRNYAAAIVVPKFPSRKAFSLPGTSAKIIPCPFDAGHTTCAQCRLCLDRDLLSLNLAIAFEAHGQGAKLARQTLAQLASSKSTEPAPTSNACLAEQRVISRPGV